MQAIANKGGSAPKATKSSGTSGLALGAGFVIVLATIALGNTKIAPIIMGVQGIVILDMLYQNVKGG